MENQAPEAEFEVPALEAKIKLQARAQAPEAAKTEAMSQEDETKMHLD